jgi:uncharacterized protein DUF5753
MAQSQPRVPEVDPLLTEYREAMGIDLLSPSYAWLVQQEGRGEFTHVHAYAHTLLPWILQPHGLASKIVSERTRHGYTKPAVPEVAARVDLRMARARRLLDSEATVTVTMPEETLLRSLAEVGRLSKESRRAMGVHIGEIASRENVTVGIIPMSAGTVLPVQSSINTYNSEVGDDVRLAHWVYYEALNAGRYEDAIATGAEAEQLHETLAQLEAMAVPLDERMYL